MNDAPKRGAARLPPTVRGFADDPPERTREMRLVAHSTTQRDLTQRVGGRQHQLLRHLDPPAGHVDMHRQAVTAFECMTKIAVAESDEAGEIPDANRSGEVGFNVAGAPWRTPARQGPRHILRRFGDGPEL